MADDNEEDTDNGPVQHATSKEDSVKDNNAGAYSALSNKYIADDNEACAYCAIINRFTLLPKENEVGNDTTTEQVIHI